MTFVPEKKTNRKLIYNFIIIALALFLALWGLYRGFRTREACRNAALGDSITVGAGDETGKGGYVALLTEKFKTPQNRFCLSNLAENGWTARQIVEQPRRSSKKTMLSQALDLKPNLVILWIGLNDVTNWTWHEPKAAGTFDAPQFQSYYKTILTSLKSNPKTKIAVGTLFDLNRAPVSLRWHKDKQTEIAQRIQASNKIIWEEAKSGGAMVVDFFDYEVLYRPENWSVDGFHPNQRGYKIIADRWEEDLRPLF